MEAVRLTEPVVEEVKVDKQLLADANQLMADARIKIMKAVASLDTRVMLCRSPSVPTGNILFREVATGW